MDAQRKAGRTPDSIKMRGFPIQHVAGSLGAFGIAAGHLTEKGDIDPAAELLEKAIARNPSDSALRGRLADIRSNIGIEFQFRYARQQSGRTLSGSDSEPVLTSDDSYYLEVKTDERCYLYVFQRDSKNPIQRLFPNPAWVKTSNPITPGEIRIPTEDQPNNWFYLDDTVGTEIIYARKTFTRVKSVIRPATPAMAKLASPSPR